MFRRYQVGRLDDRWACGEGAGGAEPRGRAWLTEAGPRGSRPRLGAGSEVLAGLTPAAGRKDDCHRDVRTRFPPATGERTLGLVLPLVHQPVHTRDLVVAEGGSFTTSGRQQRRSLPIRREVALATPFLVVPTRRFINDVRYLLERTLLPTAARLFENLRRRRIPVRRKAAGGGLGRGWDDVRPGTSLGAGRPAAHHRGPRLHFRVRPVPQRDRAFSRRAGTIDGGWVGPPCRLGPRSRGRPPAAIGSRPRRRAAKVRNVSMAAWDITLRRSISVQAAGALDSPARSP